MQKILCTTQWVVPRRDSIRAHRGFSQTWCKIQVETFPECRRLFQTLQREAIVEYAAVAAAFLIVTGLTQKSIAEVTLRGNKADYFLDDRQYLFEISGTENAEHLASRHGEKVRQLQANPFGKDGYVFVCCFSNQKARLSFRHFEAR